MKKTDLPNNNANFVLNLTKLNPYDIILTRGKGIISTSIRYATGGEYSHAIICRSKSSIAEATMEGGVFSANPQRLWFSNIDDCKVLRLNRDLSDGEKEQMRLFIGSLIGAKYSVKEAIRTPSFNQKTITAKERKQFCSRFVAQAYATAGIKIVNNPDYCSPEDLNKSPSLSPVRAPLRAITSQELAIIHKKDAVIANQKETYKWFDKAITLAKEKENKTIYSISEIPEFLIQYPQYDSDICEYIHETKYLNQYKDDEIANYARYSLSPYFQPNLDNELNMIKEIANHHIFNLQETEKIYAIYNLNYLKLHYELHKNILKQRINQLSVLEQYVERDCKNDPKVRDFYINQIISIKSHITKHI